VEEGGDRLEEYGERTGQINKVLKKKKKKNVSVVKRPTAGMGVERTGR
jgi:hypothetical protein